MVRTMIPLVVVLVRAVVAQQLTSLPTLTRPTLSPFTDTAIGPKSTVTMPIMGMQQPIYRDHPGDWYASIIGYDAEIDATTLAAGLLVRGREPDAVDITVTYGASRGSYNTTESDIDYVCSEVSSANGLVCQKISSASLGTAAVEEDITTVWGLSDMYVSVTLTAGLDLLKSSTDAPASTSTGEEGEEDEEGETGGGGGDDDGSAAVAVSPVFMTVIGVGIVVALEII